MSLISSVVRVCWLAGFPSVKQHGEGTVKMAAHGVFLLINPEGGIKARGGELKKSQEKSGAAPFNNCLCVEHRFRYTLWCSHLC